MNLNGSLYRVISRTGADGSCSFRLGLNPDHWIKECHFPGNPIVPGVFLLQMVTELLQEEMGYKLSISEIKNVKFLNVISPQVNREVGVKLSEITPVEGGVKVQAIFSDGADSSRLFARMSLTLKDKMI